MERVKIFYKERWITIYANKPALFGKMRGLMFRRSSTFPILFSFSSKRIIRLHSFFVFFRFLVLWMDKKNKVVDLAIASPFMRLLSSSKKCARVLEIPYNKRYNRVWDFFVGK